MTKHTLPAYLLPLFGGPSFLTARATCLTWPQSGSSPIQAPHLSSTNWGNRKSWRQIVLCSALREVCCVDQSVKFSWTHPGGLDGKKKKSPCSVRDPSLIPGLGRSSGKGHGNPHQYSCLENPMDRGAWQATVHGVAKESDMTE